MPTTASSPPSIRSIAAAGGAVLVAATIPTADATWEVSLRPSEIISPVWTVVPSWEIMVFCLLIGVLLGALCMSLGWCFLRKCCPAARRLDDHRREILGAQKTAISVLEAIENGAIFRLCQISPNGTISRLS